MTNDEALKAIEELVRNAGKLQASPKSISGFLASSKPLGQHILTNSVSIPPDFLSRFDAKQREVIILSALSGLMNSVKSYKFAEVLKEVAKKSEGKDVYYDTSTGEMLTKEEMEAKGYVINEDGDIVSGKEGEVTKLNENEFKVSAPKQPGLNPNASFKDIASQNFKFN